MWNHHGIKRIDDLTKEEMLSLIYYNLPNTVYHMHPCQCARCSRENIDTEVYVGDHYVFKLLFLCEDCQRDARERKGRDKPSPL